MSRSTPPLDDVQAAAPTRARLALARRRDRRREGHPHRRQRRRAALLRAARVLRRSRPAAEGRAHVALRGGRQRGDRRGRARRERRSGRDARPAHRRARARAPGRARAPRSRSRRATPSTSRRRSSGIATQEIYTLLRLGGRVRARHAPADRRRGAGHDRVPVRAGARRRRARASGCVADGFTDDEIERIFEAVPVATHNQRGLGTLHIGCPEGCDDEIDARDAARRSSRTRCRSEIYELMKRSDEAAVVEKAHRRPRFVEDCVREMIARRRRALRRRSATTRSSPRARRTSRRSTSTTSSPSASGCSASCATSSPPASTSAHHTSMREWLDAAGR